MLTKLKNGYIKPYFHGTTRNNHHPIIINGRVSNFCWKKRQGSREIPYLSNIKKFFMK
jgi:hypothetical protein